MSNRETIGMTFEELCTRIKQDYGDRLPKSAYNTPRSLIEAMKSIQEDKVIHPYASGYSFRRNVLKMQFIQAAIHYPSDRFTLKQVCEYRGLPLKKVQDMVSVWNKRGYRYLTKLPKRTCKHENIYKLRKVAIVSCLGYINMYKHGFTLNLHKWHKPEKAEIYVGINGCGRRMGLTNDALPEIKVTTNKKQDR